MSETLVHEILGSGFGLSGAVERLSGERDHNFAVAADDGRRWVLKLSDPAERADVTNLQTEVLAHLGAVDPGLPVPRLGRTRRGGFEHPCSRPDGGRCVARLLTLLPGETMRRAALDAAELEAVGAAVARLDLALADFRHRAERHVLMWDLQRADDLLSMVSAIADPTHRRLVESGLKGVAQAISGQTVAFRTQMIHNDLNPDNVFVDGKGPIAVSGLIDFGDAVRAPLVNELAVAASYHVRAEGDPFADVLPLARGYHRVLPLEAWEIEALPDLIVGRMAMTVAISSWRAERHPANRAYILRNRPAAVAGLERLATDAGPDQAGALRQALRAVRP